MNSGRFAITRRTAAAGIAAALGGFMAQAQRPTMEEQPASAANGMRTSLHQEIELPATPQRIFHTLLDSQQFAAFTGMPAQIDPKPGGAFRTFGGLIEGRNVEIVDAERIVQAWRPTSWDGGVYSIVHFELKPLAAETTLILEHTGFPEGDYDHLYSGWYARYW
ncbi:MAG: SRPBCC domain-containing protein, partial [Acidobacteriaceae bacterium]